MVKTHAKYFNRHIIQPPTTPSISSFERSSTSAMGLDNAAGASVACTEPSPWASVSKPVSGEPAARLQTPHSDKNARIRTPHSSLYLSDTPALTVSSFPSSPEHLQGPSHQTTQHGPADTSCATDEETGMEPSDDDASIHPRRVMTDPDTLMAAEVLMRLSGRNNVNKHTGTPAPKGLKPAFSTLTNIPLSKNLSQRSNLPLLHPTLATPSLFATQQPNASIPVTPTSVSNLPIASPFVDPSRRALPVSPENDQPLKISSASSNTETNTRPVIEKTAVVALAPLPPTETLQSTPQVTKSTREVEEPNLTSKSHPRKRRRDLSPAAGSKIRKTGKSRNISSSTKKSTNTFKDAIAKSSRSARKDPCLSPKSNAASDGLIGHLVTVLSLDGRSSLPFSKIVEQVLESQPHLLDERPAAEWSDLVKKTLNYSRNAMFGRAERKGLKVCLKSQMPRVEVE